MAKTLFITIVAAAATAALITRIPQSHTPATAQAPAAAEPTAVVLQVATPPAPQFTFTDASGKQMSVDIVENYQPKKIAQQPGANAQQAPKVDERLARAATIAEERANAHSRRKCWAYVKDALLASGAVSSRPETEFAKEAGAELVSRHGFKKLPVSDPYKAPVGSVLVYTAKDAPGHVEIRTKDGFVSDFKSKTPSPRPLIGIYSKS